MFQERKSVRHACQYSRSYQTQSRVDIKEEIEFEDPFAFQKQDYQTADLLSPPSIYC